MAKLLWVSPFTRSIRIDYGIFHPIIPIRSVPHAIKYPCEYLQFSVSQMYVNKIANSFPAIDMKLRNSKACPRFFCGSCSESKVPAVTSVIPSPIPEMKRLLRKQKNCLEIIMRKLLEICTLIPVRSVGFLPIWLAMEPAIKEPTIMPKQRESGISSTSSERFHYRLR